MTIDYILSHQTPTGLCGTHHRMTVQFYLICRIYSSWREKNIIGL